MKTNGAQSKAETNGKRISQVSPLAVLGHSIRRRKHKFVARHFCIRFHVHFSPSNILPRLNCCSCCKVHHLLADSNVVPHVVDTNKSTVHMNFTFLARFAPLTGRSKMLMLHTELTQKLNEETFQQTSCSQRNISTTWKNINSASFFASHISWSISVISHPLYDKSDDESSSSCDTNDDSLPFRPLSVSSDTVGASALRPLSTSSSLLLESLELIVDFIDIDSVECALSIVGRMNCIFYTVQMNNHDQTPHNKTGNKWWCARISHANEIA